MMTRRHFKALAQAIAEAQKHNVWLTPEAAEAAKLMRRTIASNVGHVLSAENERFDLPRFLAACGVL